MCPVDKGYWFDGEELDQVGAIAEKKTLRLKQCDTSLQDKMSQQITQREVAQIESRYNRYHLEQNAEALEGASFFDLSGGQKILAFLGLPVESGRFYEWRSWTNLLIILANSAVFGWMVFMAGSYVGPVGLFLQKWYMSYGLVPERFSASPLSTVHTLVTSIFIHGGIVHLLGNMNNE
jgi:membrane associated rhomboid family serine protease